VNVSDTFYSRNQKWIVLLLLLLSYPLFFYKLGARDIWEPNEDEYVQVNREMVLDDHWIYPTVNGRPHSIKPPLFNWIGSAFSAVNGEVTELTSRLPSAIAAALGMLLVYFLGRRLFGHRAGLLSALVLGTSPLYIQYGRWIQINMISAVLLTATLALFYGGYTDERKRTMAYLFMYVAAGLGTLDIGPVNAAMPVIVICLYLIAVKDVKHIFRLKMGWGILIYLAIVAPWYVTVSLRGEYGHNLIVVSNITRYFEDWWHTRPFYYYLRTAPAYFLPWFVYLPGALYLCFSERTKAERKQLLFLFVWVVGLFVFFSFAKTKRSEYVLPLFPAMALLVGYSIDRCLREWSESLFWRRLIAWPTYIVLGVLVALGFGIFIYSATLSRGWLFIVLPVSFVLCFGSLVTFFLLRRGMRIQAFVAVALVLAVSVAYGAGPVVAKRNETKSAKPFCLKVLRYLRPGENLKMYHFYRPVYGVYTGRFVDIVEEADTHTLLKWFDSKEPVYVVTTEKEYLQIKDSFARPIYVVLREWIDHRYILLISNHPTPEIPLESDTSG
jgi:4-amino-4-deoxy-L-arabinose transferase-like glycosyltransferase